MLRIAITRPCGALHAPRRRDLLAEDAAAEGAEATLVRRVAEEQCVDDVQARTVVRQACRPGYRMRVRGWGGVHNVEGWQSGGQAGRWPGGRAPADAYASAL